MSLADGPWAGGSWVITRVSYGRYSLTYTGGGSGTLAITRVTVWSDGVTETVPVAGCQSIDATQPVTVIDGDPAFGPQVVSITYTCGVTSIPVTPERRQWSVLSNPLTGESVNVLLQQVQSTTWHSTSSVQWVDLVDDPVVDQRWEHTPATILVLATSTWSAGRKLAVMCKQRPILLFRTPGMAWRTGYVVLAGDRVAAPLVVEVETPWTGHTLTVQQVARPAPRLHVATPWDTVGSTYATWNALGAANSTWATLGARDLTPAEEAVL